MRNITLASRSPKQRGQRGNTIVETALILMPMLAMFIGVLDVSMVVFLQSTLMHSTREGSRFAVTYRPTYNSVSCAASQATCITQVVEDNSFGFLRSSNANLITVNYYTVNDLSNPVETCNSGTCTQTGVLPQTLSNGKVVTYANQPGNVIEVTVRNYPWNWMLPVSAKGYSNTAASINLGGSSMDVLGSLAIGTVVPPNP
jgi:Flp pilus assembly protein TadG